jgi:hypothetical protein
LTSAKSGGRPPRDQSNALINLLEQCRFYAAKAGLFFRTARGMHYFYDQPIATFTDVHAALAFVKNRTRREATRQGGWTATWRHPLSRIRWALLQSLIAGIISRQLSTV